MDKGILVRHYNVICPACKTALTRVPSKAAIGQMVKSAAACPKCRLRITPASYQDCYVVSDHIAPILDGSKWLDLFIRHKLGSYPQVRRILTEVIDGPNELDLVANIDGNLLLAELKDCRFAIGHAYSFVGKCSQYKPKITMIIATQGVDLDVKEYIQKTGLKTHYIESLDNLETSFGAIFSEGNVLILANLISEVPWTPFITQAMLTALGATLPTPDNSRGFAHEYAFGMPRGMSPWEP